MTTGRLAMWFCNMWTRSSRFPNSQQVPRQSLPRKLGVRWLGIARKKALWDSFRRDCGRYKRSFWHLFIILVMVFVHRNFRFCGSSFGRRSGILEFSKNEESLRKLYFHCHVHYRFHIVFHRLAEKLPNRPATMKPYAWTRGEEGIIKYWSRNKGLTKWWWNQEWA